MKVPHRWFEYEVNFSMLTTENVTKTKVLPSGEAIWVFLPNKAVSTRRRVGLVEDKCIRVSFNRYYGPGVFIP